MKMGMKKFRGCKLGRWYLGLLLSYGLVSAQEETARYEMLKFGEDKHVLTSSFKLPEGGYQGTGAVTIDPGPDRTCTLTIPDRCVIESTRFIVRAGGRLSVRGSLLRNCYIGMDPGAEVAIDSCGLEKCEFASPNALKLDFPSEIKITNSILQAGAWFSPINLMGLKMMDCVVRELESSRYTMRCAFGGALAQKSGPFTPLALARSPLIQYTRFDQCAIDRSLLLTSSHVTFENSRGLFNNLLAADGLGASTSVVLPIRWINSQPEELPTNVGLLVLNEEIAGGCRLEATVEDGVLKLKGLDVQAALPLTSILPESGTPSTDSSMQGRDTLATDGVELKLEQSHVNGLLIMQLASGREAGQVTKMNITAVPGNASLNFSQPVGSDMRIALNEVTKFMRLRHKGLAAGRSLEIAFEEKYSGKDGPSAAVACGLLVESVIMGKTWDPTFAVTGDMNADGSVQPIGGVAAKVRGATKGACKIVAVPAKNERSVQDILVLDGPGPLAAIHVFALEQFNQAVQLADSERTGTLQQAVAEFDVIRSALQRDPRQMLAILRTPQAITRLQAVLEKAPHSLSAKYLLMYAQGRVPTKLSLAGSIEAADAGAMGLSSSTKNDFSGKTALSFQPDELGGSINRLKNLRPRLDPRVWPYVDSLVSCGEIIRGELLNPSRTQNKFNEMLGRARQAGRSADAAKSKLLSDPEVIEDLGL